MCSSISTRVLRRGFSTSVLFHFTSIVVCSLKRMCIPSFVLIGCCVSELHGHLCPYCNVWPELEVAVTLPSLVAPHILVFEIAKCIA